MPALLGGSGSGDQGGSDSSSGDEMPALIPGSDSSGEGGSDSSSGMPALVTDSSSNPGEAADPRTLDSSSSSEDEPLRGQGAGKGPCCCVQVRPRRLLRTAPSDIERLVALHSLMVQGNVRAAI